MNFLYRGLQQACEESLDMYACESWVYTDSRSAIVLGLFFLNGAYTHLALVCICVCVCECRVQRQKAVTDYNHLAVPTAVVCPDICDGNGRWNKLSVYFAQFCSIYKSCSSFFLFFSLYCSKVWLLPNKMKDMKTFDRVLCNYQLFNNDSTGVQHYQDYQSLQHPTGICFRDSPWWWAGLISWHFPQQYNYSPSTQVI